VRVYFDNAATMTKIPEAIEAEADFYREIDANPLRGVYDSSVKATELLEETRKKVAKYIGAVNEDGEPNADEIVFTKSATESLNMVARGMARGGASTYFYENGYGKNGVLDASSDEVYIDIESHHSNMLPFGEWYRFGNVFNKVEKYVCHKERGMHELVALTGMSNVTGENRIPLIEKIKKRDEVAIISVDGAQLLAHSKVDVKRQKIDFLSFSGHKIGAPMGVGVLYIDKKWQHRMNLLNLGGGMVERVSVRKNIPNDPFSFLGDVHRVEKTGPERFEAGTLNMGAIAGLGAAIDYWNSINREAEFEKVRKFTRRLVEGMRKIDGIKVYAGENGIVAFNVEGVHPHDTAQVLASFGICVRAGYHCAQPFLDFKGWGPVVRASLSIFNTEEEVEYFLEKLPEVAKIIKTGKRRK